MAEQVDLRKLLVLHGPSFEAQGVLDFLRSHFDVQIAEDLNAALDAMRSDRFDAVLAETGDFLPLERGAVTQQAAVVLDTLGNGVCIVGPGGEIVWANRQLNRLPQAVRTRIGKLCGEAYEVFATSAGQGEEHGRRFSLMLEGGSYYELIASPVRDRQGLLRQVAAVVIDATSQRRQQLKLNAIDRAGRELVCIDRDAHSRLDASERLRMLSERLIHCSRDVLDYQHFAVMLLDKRTNHLDMLIAEGLSPEAEQHQLFASPEGNGICGYVAATGQSYICSDVRKDRRYLAGLSDARSSLTVALRMHDHIIGVLNVESDRLKAFSEEDRQFAEIFGNYVTLALHILDLLVTEGHTARTQISGSIAAELCGPLNDIVTEASELMDDFIGHDDLRKRLGGIIDLATQARGTLKEMSEPSKAGVVAASAGPVETDPVLTGKIVLVVDDEDLIRETVHDVLVRYGCEVDQASDGEEAIAMIAARKYDLVISDIKMPRKSGYEVFAAGKTAHADTAVILMTGFGYDPGHSIVRANREGLSAVLMKPFKAKLLLDECRSALAETRN